METISLRIDLGSRQAEARRFRRANPDLTLAEFLSAYPARFPEGEEPSGAHLGLPVSRFLFEPVAVTGPDFVVAGRGPEKRLRDELDRLWEHEQNREPVCSPLEGEPDACPETITENEAVRTAYRLEMDTIADFLKHGLSVLVVCDKILTEHLYEFVCHRAGKRVVLDSQPVPEPREGAGAILERASQGGRGDPLENLPKLVNNLKQGEVLVLRSLDMLDKPPLVELLYQRTHSGRGPQYLAFLDPSLEVKKVLSDRFAVHVPISGLPRYTAGGEDGKAVYAVSRLVTRAERACFARFEPEGLYKNVAGLNAVRFRNAMRYVGARVAPGTDPVTIYRVIRQFKTSSSGEIEIPDTTFEDIGGYEHVKSELARTVRLIAGPVGGMDEKRRGSLIPRGFVFHGPPGTGKTLFAKAIANEMNATIQMVSGPEIMDKYVGQSESNLRQLFSVARRNAPAVIFFDEFDSLVSQRSTYADGGARANNAVVAQFLTELDGFRQDQTVLVIGTTNRIDIIDEALLRPSRLKAVEIGLPDYAARKRVGEIHAHGFGVDALLKDLCATAARHLVPGSAGGPAPDVPEAFLTELFERHAPYRKSWETEVLRAAFLRELQDFCRFLATCGPNGETGADAGFADRVRGQVARMARRHGLDLESGALPAPGTPESRNLLEPMRADLAELLATLRREREKCRAVSPDAFLAAVLDLVAEYTIDFNNDEIRAVFQEASLEYHMNGQLVTPRYLGMKIGMIRKRRDEREAVHLGGPRGH